MLTGQWVKLALQWRHNEYDGVSNYKSHDCLLNRLFRRRSKKTSKLRATGICEGNSPVTGESPHKRPVTRRILLSDYEMYGNYRLPNILLAPIIIKTLFSGHESANIIYIYINFVKLDLSTHGSNIYNSRIYIYIHICIWYIAPA